MVQSKATTVEEYLSSLPPDRREAISTLRELIKKNLPAGYEESMNWGMISYQIPLERYPDTYNKQPLGYVALASQKNHLAIYLLGVYAYPGGEEAFREAWAKTGKKLDMGKSCIRFKDIDDLALDVLTDTIASVAPEAYIKHYEASRGKA